MTENKLLGLTFFGLLFMFFLFTYMPYSDSVSLTNNPFGVTNSYSVDSNWSEKGTLDGVQTDGDIVYISQSSIGNWTGEVQEEEESRSLELTVNGDPRSGNVTAYVNAWESLPNGGSPDQTFSFQVDNFSVSQEFNASQYNYFNVVLELEETGGSANKRPNVDSFELLWLDESNQFGLKNEDFEIFTLFVILGTGLLAMSRYVNE